jgi:hypothetical protein
MLDQHYKSEPPATPMAFMNWALLIALLSFITNRFLFKTNE